MQIFRLVRRPCQDGRANSSRRIMVGDDDIREYLTSEGPKIRCWPNRTIYVQGKESAAGRLFDLLQKEIRRAKLGEDFL
jgi:hypothetical protein